jgi:DNA-directed RNA polymerase specialized sigma24 family protein
MQNMEHKQIAEIMNITVAKSHSLLHRAMNNLRKNENGVNLFMLF